MWNLKGPKLPHWQMIISQFNFIGRLQGVVLGILSSMHILYLMWFKLCLKLVLAFISIVRAGAATTYTGRDICLCYER